MAAQDPKPSGYQPPPHQLATWTLIGTAVVVIVGLSSIRTTHQPDTTRAYASRPMPPDGVATLLAWEPPDDEYYPCSECHEDEPTNREPRELEDEHDTLELAHGDLWCFSCHDVDERDRLRLADDTRIQLEDSWQLCTQCHGEKLPDWRAGVHGKRTGHWRGTKEYRTCVACHNAHAPPFQSIEPMPPPRRPEQISSSISVVASEELFHEQE
jgi:hypothetical protein